MTSSSSSNAIARGVRRRRDTNTLAADFRAWASLSRARRWRRHRRLRHGLETLASFAAGVGGTGVGRASATRMGAPWIVGPLEPSFPLSANWPAEGQRRQQCRGRMEQGEKRGQRGAAAVRVYDWEAVASAHRRRAALSRGIEALRLLRVGSAVELRRRRLFCCVHGDAAKKGLVVSARAVRAALRAWNEVASARRRARDGIEVATRKRLVRAVRRWKCFTLAANRQRRGDRMGLLRRSFLALRQVCPLSCMGTAVVSWKMFAFRFQQRQYN